jgi:hypothetical protein
VNLPVLRRRLSGVAPEPICRVAIASTRGGEGCCPRAAAKGHFRVTRRPSEHYSQFRSSARRRNSIVCAANRNRISGGVVMLTNKALWTIERVEVWIPLENGSRGA